LAVAEVAAEVAVAEAPGRYSIAALTVKPFRTTESVWAYDGYMVKPSHITLSTLIADPGAVMSSVETDRATLSVMRGNEVVAVISPAPIAETLADLHRALSDNPLDSTFYLDVMETRRLLGL
jgi:hypothetical protein